MTKRSKDWIIYFPAGKSYMLHPRGGTTGDPEEAYGYFYKADAVVASATEPGAQAYAKDMVVRRGAATLVRAAAPPLAKFSDDYSGRRLESKNVVELVGQKVVMVKWGNPLADKTGPYGGVTLRCESGREFFATSYMGEYTLYEVVGS